MASKYDTSAIKTFDNEVLETKLENQLITRLDMNQFITTDYSLSAQPGMKIKIRKYVGNGDVEDVAMGYGNTGDIGSSFSEVEYEVGTTQGRVAYYDEQQMNDPTAVDKALEHLSEQLTNDMTTKIVAELGKGTNKIFGFDFSFGDVVDAIATFPDETTKDETLFLLINRQDYASLQKELGDSLKYVEAFVRKGYVGTVAGVPVYMSDAVASGTAFLGTRAAVTAYIKKGNEIEQERDANLRQNKIYARNVKVIALTNDNKVVVLKTGTDPRAAYDLLATQPAGWSTYSNYYTYDPVAGEMVALTEATTFVANTFYVAK